MAEALALTASVVALLQLTDRVVSLCSQFIGHVRGAERQVAQMITTITGLKGFLEFLKGSIENDTDPERFPQLCRLSRRDGPLDLCTKLIKDIEAKMQLTRDVHGVLKALNWSLKWKDIGEALDVIEKQKTLILLAMHGDAARTTVEIADRVKEIETDVQEQKHIDVLKWLTKVDPFMNHFAARAKHEPGTGEWFVSSHEFTSWMLPGRSLWLHGIPGAGKTVLCSTIIESIKSRHVSPLIFYFDFNDQGKQSVTNMLYSFLAQLSIDRLPDAVQHLYATVCGKGTRDATIDELKETLISVADHRASEDRIWIVIDALDECSRRKELLKVFKDICKNGKINILVTSRREQDICEVLTGLVNCEIAIQDERVDQDIRVHVQRCLKDDPDLCKWDDEIKASMIGTLISKAHGIRCLKPATLVKALETLPTTLDSTYERILFQIPDEYLHEANVIFTLLAGAMRPVNVLEAAEAAAVNLEPEGFSKRNRLRDPLTVLTICSSLIKMSDEQILQFAHYSVQEYLVSDRAPIKFRITGIYAAGVIARISLIYLLSIDTFSPFSRSDWPYLTYAAEYWVYHAQLCEEGSIPRLDALIVQFFNGPLIGNALNVSVEYWTHYPRPVNILRLTASRLYYAAKFAFSQACKALIESGANVLEAWLHHGTPLQAASFGGNLAIVEMLVGQGADVNAPPGHDHGTALEAAITRGHHDITQFLLEKGANSNLVVGGRTPILTAIYARNDRALELLLKQGVHVNGCREVKTSPLSAAISTARGQVSLVKRLVDNGADVNTLNAAEIAVMFEQMDVSVAQFFLEHCEKKDIKIPSRAIDMSLYLTALSGNVVMMKSLLEYAVKINAPWHRSAGLALRTASSRGDEATVRLLLQYGSKVDDAPFGETALHLAAQNGHEAIARLLLKSGADLNYQDSQYGIRSVLQAARDAGHESMVELLREWGGVDKRRQGTPFTG